MACARIQGQRNDILQKRDVAEFKGNQEFKLYVLSEDQSVRILGDGKTDLVVFSSPPHYYPVYSTRPPHEHRLWTRLRRYLGTKIKPISCLLEFGKSWLAIKDFAALYNGERLLTQVKRRIGEVVRLALQPAGNAWFGGWDGLIFALGIGHQCEQKIELPLEYKIEVATAYELGLRDLWGSRLLSEKYSAAKLSLHEFLKQALETEENFNKIVNQEGAFSRLDTAHQQ